MKVGKEAKADAADHAADLIEGDDDFELIFRILLFDVIAEEGDEGDFVAVKDPDGAQGKNHEHVPAREG